MSDTQKSESHFQLVNRRIMATRFHLTLLDGDHINNHSLHRQACIEAALFNVYLAVLHYLNELAESYREPLVTSSSCHLKWIFDEFDSVLSTTQEFRELKALMLTPEDPFHQLLRLPTLFISPPSAFDDSLSTSQSGEMELIHLVNVADTASSKFFEVDSILLLVSRLEEIIDRQREHLIEY